MSRATATPLRFGRSATWWLYRGAGGGFPIIALLVALLCVAGFAPALAQAPTDDAQDAIVERSWLSDADGSLSPDDVLAGSWTPYKGALARGFTTTITWVRLKIDPARAGSGSVPSDQPLVLRILPSRLDEVTIFRTDRLSEPPVKVGDALPTTTGQRGFVDHSVVIHDAIAPFEVLLRLQTGGNHSMYVQALRWDVANRLLIRDSNLVVGFLVFTVMVIAWAVLAYLQRASMVLLFFIAHQGSVLLAAVTFLGVWAMIVPPKWVPLGDTLTTYAIPITTMATLLFHGRLLADLGARASHARLLSVAPAVPALGIVLIAAGFVQAGLMITHASIAIFMTLTIYVAARLEPGPLQAERWRPLFIVSAYVAICALMAPQSLRVLGLLSTGAYSFGAYFVYSVTSALLMTALLLLRAREVERLRKRDEVALGEAKRESELQRARALEQGDLIAMLTHELKTPLSVVSLALGKSGGQPAIQERAHHAIENMREVIDRCALTARVDEDAAYRSIGLELEWVQIEELITSAVSARLQSDRIRSEISGNLPACQTDRTVLLIVLANLLDNAIKYSPAGSQVRIEGQVSHQGEQSRVVVRVFNEMGEDGAPEPDHVFEKYYRGARARNRSGSGLGLYLSKRLAQILGGDLSMLPGQVSTVCFELWLPLLSAPQVNPVKRSAGAQGGYQHNSTSTHN